ncbi:MAG TPA: 23S rRNA (pseudouridine(1915)-N(3))-methyltransferase RlmH [Acidobacteriota bacterium]|nr:23S rRNA (pseudouridine(1915)-N(3))-methyltransferase RlmH [Acidobacteriota bacterium]
MKLRVLWPGKTKHAYFRDAISDYATRIKRFVPFEIVEVKEHSTTDRGRKRRVEQESKALKAEANTTRVVLDQSGKQLTSEEFAGWIEKQTRDIDFIVGGPAGLNIQDADLMLSLGKWTMPHDLVRVVLLEQVYRAFTILKNIPYHK